MFKFIGGTISIVESQHVKVSMRHWSSTNQMSSRQNQFPIGHYLLSGKIECLSTGRTVIMVLARNVQSAIQKLKFEHQK